MKIEVSKEQLSIATTRSQGAISERSLAQIGLLATGQELQLLVADRVLVVHCRMACQVTREGSTYIPARLFTDLVRQLPDGPVTP